MDKIRFGSTGWNGIIAKDFTLKNVAIFAYALATWLIRKYKSPAVVVGYDTRFGGEMFLDAVAKILASKNIRVYISEKFVSTPMISLGVIRLNAQCGVMITASDRPAEYNGIKLKGEHGGPLFENDLKDIENLISSDYEFDLEMLNWNYFIEHGYIQYINLESVYLKHIQDNFDLDIIRNSGLELAFDSMYGSTQNIFKKLLPQIKLFHCELNPTFHGIPPNPLPKNLHELEEYIWQKKNMDCSLAVNGDGDKIVLFDEKGNFIDIHRVLLLLIHYLAGYKEMKGKVIASFSMTGKVEILCKHYNLDVIRAPVGFSQNSKLITDEKLIVGEESGRLILGNHFPESDGIWFGLVFWQWLAESGKKLSELLEEVYNITGEFAYERIDMNLNKNVRNKILEQCKNSGFKEFEDFKVKEVLALDGYKFMFNEYEWALIRASKMEPILRIYIESKDRANLSRLSSAVMKTLRF